MSKSPFNIAGMSTGINIDRLGDFSFSKESSAQAKSRLGAAMLTARNRGSQGLYALKNAFSGSSYGLTPATSSSPQQQQPNNNISNGAIKQAAGVVDNSTGVTDQVVDQAQVAGSMPEASSSLVNPFGLAAQNAIGGTFGSLFDRQNSMGSALQKRACKYKNKK
tara:strand:- start:1207 stop:1698 length:492 start_codon:yes stop_codon:yes gene_type:complete